MSDRRAMIKNRAMIKEMELDPDLVDALDWEFRGGALGWRDYSWDWQPDDSYLGIYPGRADVLVSQDPSGEWLVRYI